MTITRLAGLTLCLAAWPATQAVAAEINVTMMGAAYTPAAIQAKVGDVLVFDNDDMTNHWVFNPAPASAFSLGPQKQGEARRVALRQPGRFEIECVFHPAMKIVLEVSP